MVITLTPQLAAALSEQARRRGADPTVLALDALRERFLPETADLEPRDACLVAVCHVYGVSHLLTFNMGHFVRLAGFGPGVVVVDPASV